MSDKQVNLEALRRIDERIQYELGALETDIRQLPSDEISRDLYGDFISRFNRIRALFDRTSDILRDAPLGQDTPDLYEILLTKDRIRNNYNVFNLLLSRFIRQYDRGLEEGKEERPFAPSASPDEDEEESFQQEEPDEELSEEDEKNEEALDEEALAEEEAEEKKKKAAKKARQAKAAQKEREAIEQDRAQREEERLNQEELRRTEDRRREDDRLTQDRARDAALSADLYKAPQEYDDPYAPRMEPERFYPEPPSYMPPADSQHTDYRESDRGADYRRQDERRFEEESRFRQERSFSHETPSYDYPVNRPAGEYPSTPSAYEERYRTHTDQERFYPHSGESTYSEPQRFAREDRPRDDSVHSDSSYAPVDRPDTSDRFYSRQSSADIRNQELRDAEQRANEANRREELRRERDERFERFRDRQTETFIRPDRQMGHFDYSVREGETGSREHGHSSYKTYDFREDPNYTAHQYAPGGTTERPMTIGAAPTADPQRFYTAPPHGTKSVSPEYLAQHRSEIQNAYQAFEAARGTPDERAAENRYQQLRQSYSDTYRQIRSGQLEVSHTDTPVHPADFSDKGNENRRYYDHLHTSTQYNYLPNGGIVGTGIAGAAPSGTRSYYNGSREAPAVTPSPRTDHGSRFSADGGRVPASGSRIEHTSPRTAPSSSQADRPSYAQNLLRNDAYSSRPSPAGSRFRESQGDRTGRPGRGSEFKSASYRNVLRDNRMPTPIPNTPRHFHINPAHSNPELTKVSQIPGYFRQPQKASPLNYNTSQGSQVPNNVRRTVGGARSGSVNSFGGGPGGGLRGGPGGVRPSGGTGQRKDGSPFGNGPRKGKVEEPSTDAFHRDSKLRTESIARGYLKQISGMGSGYASVALMMASRKFYKMMQTGDDNALRTMESGRYYGTTALNLASAYVHRKPVSPVRAAKLAGRSEYSRFGRYATMDKKQLTRNIHENLKGNRQLKNEIRELVAKGSKLTPVERTELTKKMAQLSASSSEARKMHGFRNLQAANAREIRIQNQIKEAAGGKKITPQVARKAMRADLQARQAAMAKKFSPDLLKATNASIRREIQQQTEVGRALKAEINKLKALQKSGVRLNPAQAARLQALLEKRAVNNQYLRKLHGITGARKELEQVRKGYAAKINRISKNQAAIRGGLYALYGLLMRPIQEGSEIGAQGLVKFANIATNHYVHQFVKNMMKVSGRGFQFVGKGFQWTANVTGLNRTRIYKQTAKAGKKAKKAAEKAKETTRAVKAAPKKAVQAAGSAVKRGAIHTYEQFAPQKVKTMVSSAYKRYKDTKGAIIAAKEAVKKWFANTWAGRAYSSASRAVNSVKGALKVGFGALKTVAGYLLLILLILMVIVQVISMTGSTSGTASSSIILSPYEGEDDKLDLKPYWDILSEEWDNYKQDLYDLGEKGGYYKTTVNMEANPSNIREILSMMAVRQGQELDLDENANIDPYLRDLLRASHPYDTEEETVTCDSVSTCSNKKYCGGSSCSNGHYKTVTDTSTDPDTGEPITTSYKVWVCDGHCGGHPALIINVRSYGFDEIFELDPNGAPEDGNGSVSEGESYGQYTITYYCAEKYPHICNAGPPYKTATGTTPTAGRTIAVDPNDIPLGTHVIIDGHEYIAEDTGGAVSGKHIDIVVATHAEALQKGTRHNVPVYHVKHEGESMEESGEWAGWTDDNRDWAKLIFGMDWEELYCGIPNVTNIVGTETDLSGVTFVNGERPGHQSIVDIALGQVGQVGGQPYWSWYGFDSRVEWCACFVSWCADQDGALGSTVPKFALCSNGVSWFSDKGQWAKPGATTPVAGDIIFFSWDSDGSVDHVGIVVGSDDQYVYTVEGNSGDKCRTVHYSLNDPRIYGYGLPNY